MGVGETGERLRRIAILPGLLEEPRACREILPRARTIEKGSRGHQIPESGLPAASATSVRDIDEFKIDRAENAGVNLTFKGEQVRRIAVEALDPDGDTRFGSVSWAFTRILGVLPNAPADDIPRAELAAASSAFEQRRHAAQEPASQRHASVGCQESGERFRVGKLGSAAKIAEGEHEDRRLTAEPPAAARCQLGWPAEICILLPARNDKARPLRPGSILRRSRTINCRCSGRSVGAAVRSRH